MEDKGIAVSPKHGVNPSICHCIVCGKEYGLALFGRLKGDKEAPKDIYEDCKGVIDKEGIMIIEVKDGETGNNPYRTGRVVGVSKEFKERNHIEHSIMYMEETAFSELFGNVEFNK